MNANTEEFLHEHIPVDMHGLICFDGLTGPFFSLYSDEHIVPDVDNVATNEERNHAKAHPDGPSEA
jgi:hypothetical protein